MLLALPPAGHVLHLIALLVLFSCAGPHKPRVMDATKCIISVQEAAEDETLAVVTPCELERRDGPHLADFAHLHDVRQVQLARRYNPRRRGAKSTEA